jgi:hypothetical protein
VAAAVCLVSDLPVFRRTDCPAHLNVLILAERPARGGGDAGEGNR